jgi:hypothetical protein
MLHEHDEEGAAMTTKRAHDPTLEAEVERAMKPYKKLLPPHMQAAFRDNLRRALTEHPKGKALLDRVRPPPIVTQSGDRVKEGASVPEEAQAASGGDKDGGRR